MFLESTSSLIGCTLYWFRQIDKSNIRLSLWGNLKEGSLTGDFEKQENGFQ